MKIKLHPEKLKANLDSVGFLIDLFMIALVLFNLGLILFDWLFQVQFVQSGLATLLPAFHDFYRDTIHNDFLFYDLCFVAVYLTEFVVRWIAAIVRNTYHRWFFYPFAHWYDLLGCIPVGSFRWLRILRVVSLLLRTAAALPRLPRRARFLLDNAFNAGVRALPRPPRGEG